MNLFSANPLADAWLGIAAGGIAIASLVWLDRNNALHRTIVCSIAVLLMLRYMTWRLLSSLPEPGLTVDYCVGVTFVSVELLSMLSATMTLFFLTKSRNRTPDVEANLSWLRSQSEPLVDVLICTFNEDRLILEQTIVGAMSMNYSNARFWICDDGRREWLRQLCEEHGCGYITRRDNAHAKAGNINNALVYLCDLGKLPEFISILDADFVPKPDFLTRCIALMRDPSVGIVQTPQHFVNPDPIQGNLALSGVWPDEQRYFFDVLMASKDAWGAAFCCGTSSVVRLNPLMQIGGFPTDSVTEDYLLTLRLKGQGFKTIYLNEQLSLGLALANFQNHGANLRFKLALIASGVLAFGIAFTALRTVLIAFAIGGGVVVRDVGRSGPGDRASRAVGQGVAALLAGVPAVRGDAGGVRRRGDGVAAALPWRVRHDGVRPAAVGQDCADGSVDGPRLAQSQLVATRGPVTPRERRCIAAAVQDRVGGHDRGTDPGRGPGGHGLATRTQLA